MARTTSSAAKASRNSGAGPSLAVWLGLALVVVMLDQFTKVLIIGNFELGDSHVVTSFFNVVRAHNHGAAFSFLADAGGWQRWFFTGLGVVASGLIVWLLRSHRSQTLFCLAITLIMGGAIGNVIDRVLYGYVVDFIQVHYQHHWFFPAFNVADSAITGGAIGLIWDELRRVRRSH